MSTSRIIELDRVAPGVRIKQLVLLTGAVYLTCVAVTNAVNVIASVGGFDWTFLNSGNIQYIASSVTKSYGWPMWFDRLVVVGAAVIEAVGAVLFWRALRLSQRPEGRRAAWIALGHNMLVWLGFIVGTEFFVAYGSESPFRELLMIGMLMAVVYQVVPDDAGATRPTPAVMLGRDASEPSTVSSSR